MKLIPSDLHALLWLTLSFGASLLLTALALAYVRRNKLLDLPGQRRSHTVPTPRGGGVGIVACVLLGLLLMPWWDATSAMPLRLIGAIALLAAIGWLDDHRPLPAWVRLVVQLVAVAIWLAPLLLIALFPPAAQEDRLDTSVSETLSIALLLAFVALWSINLHNFMDGIDGLLALQAIFVLVVLGAFGLREAPAAHPLQLGMWAAAIAGFVPFNFPRARVFMGDVGSGVIGLLIAVAVVWQTSALEIAAATGFVAVSAFLTDASCTLLSRMLSGRRWYRAHREHLYQWMTRAGMSHARVVAWYMGWNVLLLLPLLWWMNRLPQAGAVPLDGGYGCAAGVYAFAVVVWIGGKRWCLHRVRTGRRALTRKSGALHASA